MRFASCWFVVALLLVMVLLTTPSLLIAGEGKPATEAFAVKVDASFKSDKVQLKAEVFVPADKAAESKDGYVNACKDRALIALEAARSEIDRQIEKLKIEKANRAKEAEATDKPGLKGSYISDTFVVINGKSMTVPEYNRWAESQRGR